VTRRRDDVIALLRRRVLTGVRAGALVQGDRLPSARELSLRLDVDPRVVLAAYRVLAAEGLVELRPRSGIYVAAQAGSVGASGAPAEAWMVDVLAEAVRREVPATELAEWLRRAVETLRLRAVVVAATTDQSEGIAGELRGDYGLEVERVDPARLADEPPPPELRRADLVVTTEALLDQVRPVGARLARPVILAAVRPDLVGDERRRLLAQPVYVIVADQRFADLVRDYLHGVAETSRVHTLLAGSDDVDAVPEDAAVYVTRSARERLAGRRVPGRLVPTARIFSPESVHQILSHMVHANLRAAAARAAADQP